MPRYTLFFDFSGPLVEYSDGMLRVEDLNPHVQTQWRMSRWDLFKFGLRALLVACALGSAGCAGGVARHADQNRDYDRNCGYSMEELGLCSALPRP